MAKGKKRAQVIWLAERVDFQGHAYRVSKSGDPAHEAECGLRLPRQAVEVQTSRCDVCRRVLALTW